MAGELLMRSVVRNLPDAGVRLEAETGSNPISSPAEALDELGRRPDLPRLELAFGV